MNTRYGASVHKGFHHITTGTGARIRFAHSIFAENKPIMIIPNRKEFFKMKQSLFEQMGGKYERQGNYLLPCLTLPAEEEQPVGIWGQRHGRFLKEHHRILYYNLLTACKLNDHLADIDRQAEELFSRLVKQMAEREGATETLKAQDPMVWIGKMNNIRNQAEEIVKQELIYC